MCDLSASLSFALGSPLRCVALAHARFAALWRRSRPRPARRFVAALPRRFGAALSLAPGSPLSLTPGLPLCGGALAHARFAASVRRSRSRSVRRFVAAVSGGGKGSLCYLRAALSLAPGSPLRGGGFRRRQRLFVRPSVRRSRSRPVRRFVAALPRRSVRRPLFRCGGFRRQRLFVRPSGGTLAHARFAASLRRSRSRSARRFVAALSLTLGSPPSVSGGGKDFLCDLRAALSLTLGSPLRCGAPAHARLAALWRRSRSRSARRPLFPAAAKTFCATFRRRSRSRSVRRFVAALPLAPGSPFRRRSRSARLAASVRCSRSRSVHRSARRFGAALPLTLGSPPSVSGGGLQRRQRLFVRPSGAALVRARFAARSARAQSRAQKMPALLF